MRPLWVQRGGGRAPRRLAHRVLGLPHLPYPTPRNRNRTPRPPMGRTMTAPYFQDEHVTLHLGDAATVLAGMESGSADCIVTSPPYFGLRDYGVDGQIGAESSPGEYVARMVALFREARRVLADDGTLWLNLGDSYASGPRTAYADTGKATGRIGAGRPPSALPGKNLLGIPWRV